jgi:uncharacterized membrane protein
MRRLALVLAIAALGAGLTIGAVSNVAAAAIHPDKTTCTIFNGYSPPANGQAVCAYGSGTVTNSGLSIEWANGQTSTMSPPGSSIPISDRRCPALTFASLSAAFRFAGGTVVSGPLAGSHVRGRLCEYTVNPSRGVPPGSEYFQNEGLFHL